MNTSPIVQFESVVFDGEDIKSADLVEEFDPISATLPISTFDLTLYSTSPDFSLIDPQGNYASFVNKQPMAVYEVTGPDTILIGQFFLDTWKNTTDTLISFHCIDLIGLLDGLTYNGGIWLVPVKLGELLAEILGGINTPYVLDPDLYDFPISGWIPICSYREALQQIAFAAGASVTCVRQGGYLKISHNYLVGAVAQVVYCGIASAGQSRVYQHRWRRGAWNASFSSIYSGIANTGQSRNWQHRWRKAIWGSLIGDILITKAGKGADQSLALKPQVTGVEVTAHNIIQGTGTLELYNGILSAGVQQITFDQPVNDLVITGASIVESGANYAIVNVGSEGVVTLNGTVYIDTKQMYSLKTIDLETGAKPNVLKVTDATLINSSNAADVASRVYNYYQQRLLERVKLYAPVAAPGNVVVIDTLYGKRMRGIVEKMSSDLTGGFTAQTEITGVVSGDQPVPIVD